MSKIEKLAIQGIRSFGPGVNEVIQFNTPLTLIVGYNGSGKTTIIECLKYATTGDLPPNSKGGAFIHDPSLCGEKEVLAQVKLAFRSTGGHRFVVTRSLQLTVKKASRSQKTLEAALVWNNNGERTTISSKVADLDEVVPRELGVSQAVLDAVIFCHQDESLWPMSEPAALKKRFDEIFEAMRYTKAVDNIKLLRKKHGEKLTQLKISEEHDRLNKEKSDKAEARSAFLHKEIEEHREQATKMTEEMSRFQDQAKVKHEQANSFLNIINDLKNKKDQFDYRQQAVRELESSIDIMDEPDGVLESIFAKHQENDQKLAAQIEEKKSRYKNLQSDISTSRKALQNNLAEQGKLTSDKEKHERDVETRMQLIRDTARQHSIRGYDGDLGESEVQSFGDRLGKLLSDKKRELDMAQKANGEELDRSTAVITELEGKRASTTQNRVLAHNRITAVDKRIHVLLSNVKDLNADDSAVTYLGTKRQELDERVKAEAKSFHDAKWDEKLREENVQLAQLERENSMLANELVECTRVASERAQMDLRKKEQVDRQQRLETLTHTWKDKISSHIGNEWTPASVETNFSQVMSAHNRTLEDTRRRRDATKREVEQIEFKLSAARKDRAKRSGESAAAKRKVYETLVVAEEEAPDVDNFEAVLEDRQAEMHNAETELTLFTALHDYYVLCQNTLKAYDKCQLCDRSFHDQAEYRKKVQAKIEKHMNPNARQETIKDLEAAKPVVAALQAARSQFDAYKRLSTEIPTLDVGIKALEAERNTLVLSLEEKDALVKEAEDKHADLDSLSKAVTNIAQLTKELEEGQSQISRLESQHQSFAGSRSAEEIHELQTSIGDRIRAIKQRIDRLAKERQHGLDLSRTLELERSELVNKMKSAERQLERKQDLETQIRTLREDRSHQQEIIQQADQELKSLEPDIEKARTIREQALATARAKERKLAQERDGLADSSSELRKIDASIQDYVHRGRAEALAANQRAISTLEHTLEQVEQQLAEATKEINRLREESANSVTRKKNVGDNIKYRNNVRTLEKLKAEIMELESRNATEDYERLVSEAQWNENQYSKLLAERASIIGTMKTKDEEFQRLSEEWAMDYRDAAKRYKESHIKVETTKAAIEDLGKFSSALDKAVMEYHKRKMEDVNRIAGELWQSTYQGTDIDTILIRSDNETASGKRSYNYRVCMVKQNTEMDMRGRCSAGQKVLASIIIRLALAESFGTNCGLIALDEPTTNLDSDNIRSLARSLHDIINQRQQQSNFQLIVITHDEEFLRYMRCQDFCDTFFKVSRNERQNSVIEVKNITLVAE